MTEWGVKPQFTKGEWHTVSSDYQYQKGEYGKIGKFVATAGATEFKKPEDYIKKFVEEMKNKGAEVLYIDYDVKALTVSGKTRFWQITFNEVIFKGSPIAPAVIIAVIMLIGLIIISLRPVFLKWAGVDPYIPIVPVTDWAGLIIAGLIVVVGLFIYMRRR